ncbi:MAG: hypothetical protein HY707_11975 [Ignavibacteriae bacterium]|nr:hypothetical protein [Ignavibacteriota bacterium]
MSTKKEKADKPITYRLEHLNKTDFNLLLILVIFGLILLAWSHRFIQDDAFISFRYAQNLIEGYGLVWNPNERIEGYTNFLWTLLMSFGISIGIDPVSFSYTLGLIFFILTLTFTYKTSYLLMTSRVAGVITVILLGTNYTFSSFATGGLETQMQASLFIASCFFVLEGWILKSWTTTRIALLSGLITLTLLTRLDSAILSIVIVSIPVITIFRGHTVWASRMKLLFMLTAPILIVVGGWFFWKLSYYGDILPNSFYIKVATETSITRGLNYLYLFTLSYLLFPFPFIWIAAVKELFKKSNLQIVILCLIFTLWLSYVVKIGGDFMEFRFLVPSLPLFFIVLGWLIFQYIKRTALQVALVVLIPIGSFYHGSTFKYNIEDGIEDIRQLHGHLINPYENWIGIGKVLGKMFKDDTSLVIGTTAAGAIPYYSGLKTIDMLGVNDRWIADSGYFIGFVPGHQRIAPFEYLLKRKVNLVISHPLVLKRTSRVQHIPLLPKNPGDDLSETQIMEIPLDTEYKFVVLYLAQSAVVDSAIKMYNWKAYKAAIR